MIVRIQKRENPYVQIDKSVLEDSRLSWKAKGLLTYLLSKPDKWRVNHEDLKKKSKDGRDAIYAALKELREAGYAELVNAFDENGKLLGKEWVIHEQAISGKSRNGKIPNRENPDYSNNDKSRDNELSAVSDETADPYTFEDFWDQYGFKKGVKAKACERFNKLSGAAREAIRLTLPLYLGETVIKDNGRKNGNFKPMRKYPEFYLSGRLWENYIEAANARAAEDAQPTPYDDQYQKYIDWVRSNYPHVIQETKHMSKTQFVQFKTTIYAQGKGMMGQRLELEYLTDAHKKMEADRTARDNYPDVFALHCENVQRFAKANNV